jgi:hypothetical protein
MIDAKPPAAVRPHPKNCEGPFYVEDGCCITCGIPLEIAPEIFAWSDSKHESGYNSCIVMHQPQTAEQLSRTLEAMFAAEVDCVRYRGSDPDIARRIVELNLAHRCDQPPPTGVQPLVRDHVTFSVNAPADVALDPAEQFSRYLFERNKTRPDAAQFKSARLAGPPQAVRLSWYDDVSHIVEFAATQQHNHWLARCNPGNEIAARGLSSLVNAWLKNAGHTDIRWFSTAQWQAGGPWSDTVF